MADLSMLIYFEMYLENKNKGFYKTVAKTANKYQITPSNDSSRPKVSNIKIKK